MTLTKAQRIAFALSAAAVTATIVMPPWKYVDIPSGDVAGYSWIWSPIGRSPCRIAPSSTDLDYVRGHPDAVKKFTEHFRCTPDQAEEQASDMPSDIAWNILCLEWMAILLVTGLTVVSLHRRPRDNVSERAIQLSKPTRVADPPSGGSLASASSPLAAGMSGVARRLGVPLTIVIGKIAYLAAIFIGWLATWGVAKTLLRTYGWQLGGVGHLFIAAFFLVWLRHVYRSEGGKVAALILSTGGLALALIVLVIVPLVS